MQETPTIRPLDTCNLTDSYISFTLKLEFFALTGQLGQVDMTKKYICDFPP
jgi:hypothetical protein